MPETPDAWKLDTGLPDAIDLTIDLAYFKTHAEYMNGQVYLLFLIGRDQNDEPQEMRLSVGGDWSSSDGGRTIKHPNPSKTKINRNSIYGHFIDSALALDDKIDGKTLADVLYERDAALGATNASVWEGLVLHLDRTEIKFGKNVPAQERLLPTKWLGYADVQHLPLTQAPATAIVESTPSPKELVEQARRQAAQGNGGSPVYDRMVELAKRHDTHQAFMAEAFKDPEALADDEIADQIAKEDGIWAVAKGTP